MLSYKPTDCLVNMISNLIKPGKSWNLDLMNLFFSKNEAITISIIPLSQCDQVNSIVWSPNQSGPYTVRWVIKKPAMFGQFDFRGSFIVLLSSTCPVEDYLGISCPPPPPQIKILWWKVCCNALAFRENLWIRKCCSSECLVCALEIESIEHILFRCPRAQDIWRLSKLDFVTNVESICSAIKWTCSLIENCYSSKKAYEKLAIVGSLGLKRMISCLMGSVPCLRIPFFWL